jgi:hypothetical protein
MGIRRKEEVTESELHFPCTSQGRLRRSGVLLSREQDAFMTR